MYRKNRKLTEHFALPSVLRVRRILTCRMRNEVMLILSSFHHSSICSRLKLADDKLQGELGGMEIYTQSPRAMNVTVVENTMVVRLKAWSVSKLELRSSIGLVYYVDPWSIQKHFAISRNFVQLQFRLIFSTQKYLEKRLPTAAVSNIFCWVWKTIPEHHSFWLPEVSIFLILKNLLSLLKLTKVWHNVLSCSGEIMISISVTSQLNRLCIIEIILKMLISPLIISNFIEQQIKIQTVDCYWNWHY